MKDYLDRKLRRVEFYARGVIRDLIPTRFLSSRRLKRYRDLASRLPDRDLCFRVNYYNKVTHGFSLDPAAVATAKIAIKHSYYYYDLKEYTKCFDSSLRLEYLFGDVTHVPPRPTIVKSRPIGGGNQNSVIMKLDKLRHFHMFARRDKTPFREKASRAAWRGALNSSARQSLVDRYSASARHDIGYVGRRTGQAAPKEFLSVDRQLQNRYLLAPEGIDVASNLKWIMASKSLCLMPRPRYETWLMEGRLIAGQHFVEVRPDFADLDEKVDYFDRHLEEAEAIIANANSYLQQFADTEREDLISVLVLQKYFERSGQLPPEPFSAELFQPRADMGDPASSQTHHGCFLDEG